MQKTRPIGFWKSWSVESEAGGGKAWLYLFCRLKPVVGSEQGGVRPVLVIQNDVGNRYSPTVIIAAITSQIDKAKLPTHVEINAAEYHLDRDSVVLLEQIRRLINRGCKKDYRTG